MWTRTLMLSSALLLLILGAVLTFAPQEVLSYGGSTPQQTSTLTAQTAGALYLGFAMLNWMAKDNLIGGIYSRPVAMGNLLHFFALSVTLLKTLSAGHREPAVVAVTLLYVMFAAAFMRVVFWSPARA